MFRTLIRGVLFFFGGLAVLVGLLYAIGVRLSFGGSGTPQLTLSKSAEAQAAEIEKHREAQRARVAAPAPGQSNTAADAAASMPSAAENVPAVPPIVSTHWTSFRGPDRDGHYRQQPVRTDWGARLAPLWKQPVGSGYASFVVAEGRAFTIEQRGARELATAYDLVTGRELWTSEWNARFNSGMGGDGPRATPAWADGKLYALGATGEFRALDAATGRTLWRTNILDDARADNIEHGLSGSPLVVGTLVIVMPGGGDGRSVVAYDRHTGKRAWSALDERASYSSPMLATLGGVRQILAFTSERLVGLSPESGALLWEFDWNAAVSQPLITAPDRVFISTEFGAVMLQVTAGADGKLEPRELWRTTRMNNKFTSPVLHEGFIYGLDGSILACIDATTGDLKWKGGRYGYGQVLLASSHLIVLTEEGELALVRAEPGSHQEVTRFPAIEGKTWNHPAMSDGILLIRNVEEMAAFDLRKGAEK